MTNENARALLDGLINVKQNEILNLEAKLKELQKQSLVQLTAETAYQLSGFKVESVISQRRDEVGTLAEILSKRRKQLEALQLFRNNPAMLVEVNQLSTLTEQGAFLLWARWESNPHALASRRF